MNDTYNHAFNEWPETCKECGIGPGGKDYALLNGECEYMKPLEITNYE